MTVIFKDAEIYLIKLRLEKILKKPLKEYDKIDLIELNMEIGEVFFTEKEFDLSSKDIDIISKEIYKECGLKFINYRKEK